MSDIGDSTKVQALINKICQVRYSDLELERTCCNELLEIGVQKNDPYAICYAHTYLGDYHYASGNFIDSEHHLSESRKYCALHGFSDLLLSNYTFSGHLFKRIANEQRSLDFYLDGIALAEELGNNTAASLLYSCIGIIFDAFGDYTEAMSILETAYSLQAEVEMDDTTLRRHITLLANLSEIACQLNMYEKARAYLREAETLIHGSTIDLSEFAIIYIAKVFCVDADQPGELQAVLDEMFALKPETWEDKNLAFDLLLSIAKRLLKIEEYTCLRQVLDLLTKACEGTEYAYSLSLHSLYISLQQHTDEQDEKVMAGLYRAFYDAYSYGDAISQELRTAGFLAKINLRRTLDAAQARNKVLEEVAYLDELTQTHNRRYLSEFLKKFPKYRTPHPVCIAMFDLDYFKEYNDTYGHLGGDHALRSVANCLLHHAPKGTFVVRYGGDEFLAVCFDISEEEAANYLQQVRDEVETLALAHKNSRCPSKIVTLSIGYCSTMVQSVDDFETALVNADKALYVSKCKGRDMISPFI